MKRSRRRESAAEKRAREHFNEAVLEHPCQFLSRAGHECEGEKDAHHLVKKSELRVRLSQWPEESRLAVMYSPLIGAPLCRRAHDLVTAGMDRIYWEELTPEAIEFVSSLPSFVLLRLEELCPKRERRAA